MDGDPLQNLDAFEKVIRCMKEAGIGYGSVNHPVDRDPARFDHGAGLCEPPGFPPSR